MVTSRRISRFLLDRLTAEAAARPGVETCGLLLGAGDDIVDAVPLPNVAKEPRTSFLIDPDAQLLASREARVKGQRVLGCYHSHPSGLLTPSAADAAQATQSGFLWLIVSMKDARLWISRGDGRFDPLHIHLVEPSPCNLGAQSPIGAEVCETTGAQPE
jgi:desampylase